MRLDIITLFPEMFRGPFEASIVARAIDQGIVEIALHNLRSWGLGRHQVVDDYPYGGGAGMLLKPEPAFAAVEAVQALTQPPGRVILLTPQGERLTQGIVTALSGEPRLVLLCGHYEGVDERVREHLADDEISIGDYVLSGGEIPAMALVDAVVRLLPGSLGGKQSLAEESHVTGLLEYPQYTRPADFRGWHVPDVLLSGHHEEVGRWRRRESLLKTYKRRPDLLERAVIADDERTWLREHAGRESCEDTRDGAPQAS